MKNKFLLPLVVLLSVSLGIYIGHIRAVKKSKKLVNIFETESEKSKKTERDIFFTPLIEYKGKKLFFGDLPIAIQRGLMRSRLNYLFGMNEVLKSFAVEYHTAQGMAGNSEEVKASKLEDIVTFYTDKYKLVDGKEIVALFEKSKHKDKEGLDKAQAFFDIQISLLMDRIVKHTKHTMKKLHRDGSYRFLKNYPVIPRSWYYHPMTPTLGGWKDSEYNIDVFLNYRCVDCRDILKQIGEIFKKYKQEKFSLSVIHYSKTLTDLDYYLNKSSICVYEQDKDIFWKFNLEMLKRSERFRLFNDKENFANSKKEIDSILAKKVYSAIDKRKFNDCLKEQRILKKGKFNEKIPEYLRSISEKTKFLANLPKPAILVNGRLVEHGISLIQYLDGLTRGEIGVQDIGFGPGPGPGPGSGPAPESASGASPGPAPESAPALDNKGQ